MKKSTHTEEDFLRGWIKSTGGDKAPKNLLHDIMSQVEVEPINRYTSPIGIPFKIGSILLVCTLIIVAFFIPQSETGILSDFLSKEFPEIHLPNLLLRSISIPDFINTDILLYVVITLGVLFMFDRFLARLFSELKR